jgi:inorganic pyrophosphatase
MKYEKLDTFSEKDQEINTVIETPKGSRNEYALNPEMQVFALDKILPAGAGFPFNFGFIPQTKAEDGDPLDVIVIMDDPAFPGCVIPSRVIGVIKAEQTDKGKKPERNDRIIAR